MSSGRAWPNRCAASLPGSRSWSTAAPECWGKARSAPLPESGIRPPRCCRWPFEAPMIRRRLRCLALIAALAMVAGCSGQTVVGEREPATTPADTAGAGWWPPPPEPQEPEEPETSPTDPSADGTTGEPPTHQAPLPTEPEFD